MKPKDYMIQTYLEPYEAGIDDYDQFEEYECFITEEESRFADAYLKAITYSAEEEHAYENGQ